MKLKQLNEQKDMSQWFIDDMKGYISDMYDQYVVATEQSFMSPSESIYWESLSRSSKLKLYSQAAVQLAQSFEATAQKIRRKEVGQKRQGKD